MMSNINKNLKYLLFVVIIMVTALFFGIKNTEAYWNYSFSYGSSYSYYPSYYYTTSYYYPSYYSGYYYYAPSFYGTYSATPMTNMYSYNAGHYGPVGFNGYFYPRNW